MSKSPLASTRQLTSASLLPIRPASMADAPILRSLIDLSVRELQKDDYSPDQLALAVKTVFTLDTQLMIDGTYFVIETRRDIQEARQASEEAATNTEVAQETTIVACGGWSRRRTLCGGDSHVIRDHALLNPETDAAKIRAFFVHPAWARRGLGSRLLAHCEQAAQREGFHRFEMAATLTGVPLYLARGYHVVEQSSVPLCGSSTLPVVLMARSLTW